MYIALIGSILFHGLTRPIPINSPVCLPKNRCEIEQEIDALYVDFLRMYVWSGRVRFCDEKVGGNKGEMDLETSRGDLVPFILM